MKKENEREKPKRRKPLAGSALEERLLELIVKPLRSTDRRKEHREETGAGDDAIEHALGSSTVLSGVAHAQNAFTVEHWPVLLHKLFEAAEKKEAWAWRILLDVAGVAEQLRAASGEITAESAAAFDQTLPPEIRELLKRADEDATPDQPSREE